MGQLTVRASDELLERVRAAALRLGRSMNEYVVGVLGAATDPDLAGNEAERVRERLAQAGLLGPSGPPRPRPDEALIAAARTAAGRGTPLSAIVSSDRQ